MKKTITTFTLTLFLLSTNSAMAQGKPQPRTNAGKGTKIGAITLGGIGGLSMGILLGSLACESDDCRSFNDEGKKIKSNKGKKTWSGFTEGFLIGGLVGASAGAILGAGIGALIPNRSNIQVNPLILNEADGMYSGASVNVKF